MFAQMQGPPQRRLFVPKSLAGGTAPPCPGFSAGGWVAPSPFPGSAASGLSLVANMTNSYRVIECKVQLGFAVYFQDSNLLKLVCVILLIGKYTCTCPRCILSSPNVKRIQM